MMRNQRPNFPRSRTTSGRRTTERLPHRIQQRDWPNHGAPTRDLPHTARPLMNVQLPGKQHEEVRRPFVRGDPQPTQHPPTVPAHQEPTTTGNGELVQLLKTLMERMDRLENNLSDRGRPRPKEGDTGGQRGREKQPVASPQSNNPDFTDLWKGIYRGVQLRHHAQNWNEIPSSIRENLLYMADLINPPIPSAETSQKIKDTMLEAGKRIQSTIQEHLTDQMRRNYTALENMNHLDLDQATCIAKKHLLRRLGWKTKKPTLDAWTEEIVGNINSPEAKPPRTASDNNTESHPPIIPLIDQLLEPMANRNGEPRNYRTPRRARATTPDTPDEGETTGSPTETDSAWTTVIRRPRKKRNARPTPSPTATAPDRNTISHEQDP